MLVLLIALLALTIVIYLKSRTTKNGPLPTVKENVLVTGYVYYVQSPSNPDGELVVSYLSKPESTPDLLTEYYSRVYVGTL